MLEKLSPQWIPDETPRGGRGADKEISGRAASRQLADARLAPRGQKEGTGRAVTQKDNTHWGKTRLPTPFSINCKTAAGSRSRATPGLVLFVVRQKLAAVPRRLGFKVMRAGRREKFSSHLVCV